MLYNLLVPFSQDISLLNVFRYITFRSAGALICALLFTILAGPWFLKKLTALKVGQPILSYVPEHQAKAGTPTMGGLLIMAGAIVSTLLWADLATSKSWVTITIVCPAATSSSNSSKTFFTFLTSKAPVGSSAKITRGRFTKARALDTLWRSPPESWLGVWFCLCNIPTLDRASCARST